MSVKAMSVEEVSVEEVSVETDSQFFQHREVARDLPLRAGLAGVPQVAVFSRGIQKIGNIQRFFALSGVLFRPSGRRADEVDAVLVWGNKETGRAGRAYAERYQKPVWRIEDGFFRSHKPGTSSISASLVLDDCGVYYDARSPSRLEKILQDTLLLQGGAEGYTQLTRRAAALLSVVRARGISKYNDGCAQCDFAVTERERILVIDQTFGDASIEGGLSTQRTFDEMLERTIAEYPRAEIVVKQHPEVAAGKKRGCLDTAKAQKWGARVLTSHVGPYELLGQVDHVVTVTSQFGFDALCAGKTVSCFGAPFYAGWGLTTDRIEIPRRTRQRTLEEVCAACWLLYPSYVHPVTGLACEVEEVVDHLALQRSKYLANEGKTWAVGFSKWKRRFVAPFLEGPGEGPMFVSESSLVRGLERDPPDRVVCWGQRLSSETKTRVRERRIPILCMEDGFLRSNVLGSDLTRPLSVVVDGRGIYYDATAPSDLEHLLENHLFTDSDRAQGGRLIQAIKSRRLSKYNVQKDAPIHLPRVEKVLLVVGQVDDDAAIRLGTRDVSSNEQLLRKVREENPHSFLLYKPHPDVLSGNRRGAISREIEGLADWVEKDHSVTACLDVATEVHTMTSLVGFEGLLRGLPVKTYGSPFYAGWGLTEDRIVSPRRTRKLRIEELVHGALGLYPTYYASELGCFLTAEQAATELAKARDRDGWGDVSPTVRRRLSRLRRYLGGLFRHA